ncbi:hypothetical protein Tco_0841627 [Tanacetum coccineum]|uniref:Reverse transcriptase domain-containing protein n=1 Tax=Tanacetum coccineum TaxID=301880 RepID=A0ABQ5AXJ1_9ASTR
MIRNDRIFGVRIRGLLVGMGMAARVRVTTTSASTGISQLRILTRVMLQVLQVRGGLLRLCLLHLFVLPVESLIRVFVIRLLGDVLLAGYLNRRIRLSQAKQKQNMPADFARLPPTTGRVYATTRDQAAKTSGTITGILYMRFLTVFVLFDTRATHSIISTTFAKKLNMTPTPLIERVGFLIRATIDVYARTLISHGCQGFSGFPVMDSTCEDPNIENLSLFVEFADVFPDELPGIPPAREIEFGIELIPGAEPISKALVSYGTC